jgi:hypothetical protein
MTTPVTDHPVDVVTDSVTREDLEALARTSGAHVSLLMPTVRMGPETRAVSRQYRRMCEQLRELAASRNVDGDLVDRVEQAGAVEDFWQQQAEGLAVVAGPDEVLVRRLGAAVGPELAVGRPRLRPLLPHVTDDATFHILALSMGRVRLFEAGELHIRELDLGTVPASYDELEHDRDRQHSLQWSAQGGQRANFHGHGGDAEADRTQTLKFFRLVSTELRRRLPPAAGGGPLVLACVPENLALFRDAGGHPQLLEDSCAHGNADRLTAVELHQRCWPLAAPWVRQAERKAADHVQELMGTGRVLTDTDQVLEAAWEGRVEWLFVSPAPAVAPGETEVADDPVDLVLSRVLASGGRAALCPASLREVPDLAEAEIVALLRW